MIIVGETDDRIRSGRYRVEVADLVTLRTRGKLYWDTIGTDVSWATAEAMVDRERSSGGSARVIDLETGALVPSDDVVLSVEAMDRARESDDGVVLVMGWP